jgi:hypothetical protein
LLKTILLCFLDNISKIIININTSKSLNDMAMNIKLKLIRGRTKINIEGNNKPLKKEIRNDFTIAFLVVFYFFYDIFLMFNLFTMVIDIALIHSSINWHSSFNFSSLF